MRLSLIYTTGTSTFAIKTVRPVSRDLYKDTSIPSYEVEVSTTLSKLVSSVLNLTWFLAGVASNESVGLIE